MKDNLIEKYLIVEDKMDISKEINILKKSLNGTEYIDKFIKKLNDLFHTSFRTLDDISKLKIQNRVSEDMSIVPFMTPLLYLIDPVVGADPIVKGALFTVLFYIGLYKGYDFIEKFRKK